MHHTSLSGSDLHEAVKRVAHLADAFDLLSQHVVITDADARIIYANAAAVQATGFSFPEMLGKNPADLWGGHMSEKFYTDMWERIKTEKKPFMGTVRNVDRDGKEVWQELRISPVLNDAKEVDCFIGVEGVVTEHLKKDTAKEDIASVISHEALSPLTAIRWHLEWILERGGLQDDVRMHLEEMLRHAERTIATLHDLAALSRMGKGHPSFEEYHLGERLKDIASHEPRRWTMDIAPCTIHTIPSLADEFLASLLSAVAGSLKDKAIGLLELTSETEQCVLRLTLSDVNLRGDAEKDVAQALRIPVLIGRYLHWGTLRSDRTKDGVQWIMTIPCHPQ